MLRPGQIVITETATEYLVQIHASEKERAKGIAGRRWDERRAVWCYPRSQRVLESLLAEFADDADFRIQSLLTSRQGPLPESPDGPPPAHQQKATPPNTGQSAQTEAPPPSQPSAEVLALRASLVEHEEKTRQLETQLRHSRARLSALERALAEATSSVAALKAEIDAYKARIAEASESLTHARGRERELKKEAASLKEALAQASSSPSGNIEARLKRQLLESPAQASSFSSLVAPENHEGLSGVVLTYLALEARLRRVTASGPDAKLADMIFQANERDLLDKEAMGLAHLIRVQRNLLTHDSGVDPGSTRARALIVMLAAFLLWPHLDRIDSHQPNC